MKRTRALCLLFLMLAGCSQAPSYTVFKDLSEPLPPAKTACVGPIDRSSVVVKEPGGERGPSPETAERIRSIIMEELTSKRCFSSVTRGLGPACDTDYEVQGRLTLYARGGENPQAHPDMMYVDSKEDPFKVSMIISIRDTATDRVVFSAQFESGTSNIVTDEEEAFRELAKHFADSIARRQ